MGLVADDQVPVGLLELGLDVLVAAELVEAADGQRVLGEPVAGPGRFQSLSLVMISNGRWNRRSSSSCHCSTRLPGQTIRQRCRSPRAISSLMKQPGHDRLAGARVVGQQEAQRLAGQHLARRRR